MPPNIIYQDEDIIVIDKPPGLVVDDSETVSQGSTLQGWLAKNYPSSLPRMGIVHRLDKDTSGLLLVAKTQTALENLQSQFQERKVKKEYLVLVHGLVEVPGKVDAAIGRNPVNRQKFTVMSTSKESKPTFEVSARAAVTEYELLKRLQFTGDRLQEIFHDFNKIQFRKLSTIRYNLFTLLACHPLTGRTHQIRVHLKYIGHPVVADGKYLGRKMYRLDHRWCSRQFLHAAKIGFYHPGTGKWIEFESKMPEDLRKVLDKYG